MPLILSILGASMVFLGGVLMWIYREPQFDHSVVHGGPSERASKFGARGGLALTTVGTIAQIVAVALADKGC